MSSRASPSTASATPRSPASPDLRTEDVEAVVVGTDLRRTGWFDSSHELLNRFHENVVWGMRGNFVDVPTDCPQRDERLGWTGDIQVFAPTASFLFDSAGFLTTWLADLAAEQQKDGSVPFVVPDVLRDARPGRRGLGRRRDDRAVGALPALRRRRAAARGSCRACAPGSTRSAELAGADRLWTGGFQFGDWLDPTAPPDAARPRRKADPDVVATAYLARSAELVAQAAEVLGEPTRRPRVRATWPREVRAGVRRRVRDRRRPGAQRRADRLRARARSGRCCRRTSSGERAGDRLAELVRTSGYRISTGFVGTPLITDALTAVRAR